MLLPPGKWVGALRNEWLCECPACGKKDKFYWNTDKEVGWCHSCQKKVVGQSQLSRAFSGLEEVFLSSTKSAVPKTALPSLQPAADCSKSLGYLMSRWVDAELSLRSRISYSESSDEIWVPIHPLCSPYPMAWMRRNISYGGWRASDGMRKAHYAFGHEVIPEESRNVILVEGVFDVLSPGLYGYAMALLGVHLSGTQLAYLVNRFDEFLVWLDPDKPGQLAAHKICKRLNLYGKQAVVFNPGVEPGDMGPRHPIIQELKETSYVSTKD